MNFIFLQGSQSAIASSSTTIVIPSTDFSADIPIDGSISTDRPIPIDNHVFPTYIDISDRCTDVSSSTAVIRDPHLGDPYVDNLLDKNEHFESEIDIAEECAVCFNKKVHEVWTSNCNHSFCFDCLCQTVRKDIEHKCPECREKVHHFIDKGKGITIKLPLTEDGLSQHQNQIQQTKLDNSVLAIISTEHLRNLEIDRTINEENLSTNLETE